MFMYARGELAGAEVDLLFPRHEDALVKGQAEEALQSHIITGFEEALGLGMPPMEALSQVLSWVATEMARLHASEPRT
jgi:hypothetical protein